MVDFIKLEKSPEWLMQYPQCSACLVDLDMDDGWQCPVCGTAWDSRAGDGDTGTLFESWSGETLDVEVTPVEKAWRVGAAWDEERLDRMFAAARERRAAAV